SSATSGASVANGVRRRHSTTALKSAARATTAAPTGSFQPPPPLVGARPEPGSPAANGRSPDWPRRPLKLGGRVGPPLGLGPASSSCELAGDAAGVGSKVIQP